MKLRVLFSALALAAMTISGLGFAPAADAQVTVKTIRGKDRVMYRKKTVIDFEDSTVEGELVKPEQSSYTVRGRAKFNSLIKYRLNFLNEMWNTARNL
ncbi:MAG: hypothetical protein EP343_30870 [Deltaproteobacteria bacterium]|nr:MAG: hypothetical protein EP343_30870 [Deltaproteobacteria bacterium]